MGYTHYWEIKPENLALVRNQMPYLVADFRRLLPKLPPLASSDGRGEPLLTAEEVVFNGVAPEDYESFHFPPREGGYITEKGFLFSACKTGQRPYDLAVTAFLTLARWHLGEAFDVSSDGEVGDWVPATSLVERELGYPVDPFWVLNRRVLLVQDGAGRRFYTTWKKGETGDRLEALVHTRFSRLEEPAVEKLYGKKWPFRGPYTVLDEDAQVGLRELLALKELFGAYILGTRSL